MNVFEFLEQLVKFSRAHPLLSFAAFSLVWIYAVTKTYQAFAEANEKLVLTQRHIVEVYLSLEKATGVTQVSLADLQRIHAQALKEKNGAIILFGLGILLPFNFFAFLTNSSMLIVSIILLDAGLCFLIYRAVRAQREAQKRLKSSTEKAPGNT